MRVGQSSAVINLNSSDGTSKQSLDKVKPGDTIKAEVLSSNDKSVVLKLADGTKVNAQRSSAGALPEGETLDFTVTSKSGGQLTVALTDPSVPNQNVDTAKLLRAFGEPVTPQNTELVREMLAGGVPFSKENFRTLNSVLSRNPGLTPQQAVFMAREGIPVTPQNIMRFQAFLQHQNLVGDQLQNILGLLENAAQTGQSPASANPADASLPGSPAQDAAVPQTAVAAQSAAEQMPDAANAAQQSPNEAGDAGGHAGAYRAASGQTGIADANTASTSAASSMTHDASVLQQEGAEHNAAFAAGADVAQAGEATPKGGGTVSQEGAVRDGFSQNSAAQQAASQDNNSGLHSPGGGFAPGSAESGWAAQQKNAAHVSGTIQAEAVESGNADIRQAAESQGNVASEQRNAVQTAAGRAGESHAAGVQGENPADTQSRDLEKLITSLFRKVDPAHAHRLPKDMDAKAVVRELQDAIGMLQEKLASMPEGARAPLERAVAELDQSVRFMNQLNSFTPVVSIPLQWGDGRTTAELYVFNDSQGKKRIDPQNATVFLSLMTANAGRVETLVKVLGKNVECDFKLELEETVGLVQNDMHKLSSLLDSQGFHLSRTSVREKGDEEAADLFDVGKVREENKARYFFDRKV